MLNEGDEKEAKPNSNIRGEINDRSGDSLSENTTNLEIERSSEVREQEDIPEIIPPPPGDSKRKVAASPVS